MKMDLSSVVCHFAVSIQRRYKGQLALICEYIKMFQKDFEKYWQDVGSATHLQP